MSTFYKLAIKDIIRETPSAISVVFNIPQELKDKFKFKAGQYVTLKATLDGEEIRRSYSISSTPSSEILKISIKEVKNGVFSKFANQQLAINNILEVSQPEGRFIFEPQNNNQKNYLAIAAGSGITPIFSIIKTALEQESNSNFVLIYGNKSTKDTIFYNQIQELKTIYNERFSIFYVFSQEKVDDSTFGRIDKAIIHYVLKNKLNQIEIAQAFLCGPEDLINTAKNVLLDYGLEDTAIKFELFSSSISEKKATNQEGIVKITVLVDDVETTFEMNAKQTILEASLKKGLDVPYSCQGGICSSCIARIQNGSAEMVKNSVLTDSEIAEKLVLTCQAHPTSNEIYIDYDDV